MIIRIDQTSTEPLYLQIRQQIVAAIARGGLRPGDSLPSVRSLAHDLGINLHTVNKAYALLRDEGYVLMRGRAGAFIAESPVERAPARAVLIEEQIEKHLHALVLEHKAAGGTYEAFLSRVKTICDEVYGDPGVAGAKRDVRVLGLDEQGNQITSKGQEGSIKQVGTSSAETAV